MVGAIALQPRGVGDAAVLHRHVEVDAQQHALALHVDVIEGAEVWHASRVPDAVQRSQRCTAEPGPPRTPEFVTVPALRAHRVANATRCAASGARDAYSSFPIATAVSAMRLEKPHSLSYHDITRTSVPFCTLVWSMWKVDECGSWLKSIETLGAVV